MSASRLWYALAASAGAASVLSAACAQKPSDTQGAPQVSAQPSLSASAVAGPSSSESSAVTSQSVSASASLAVSVNATAMTTGSVAATASASAASAGSDDAGMPSDAQDAASHDADAEDAGNADGGCKPFVMPEDCTIPAGAVLPGELRCTGLYGNWDTRELHCGVREYAPAYPLWSDGSEKFRYVYLPPGAPVDVTEPNDFRYPVGTQFWKEFRVPDGDHTRLGETRLMRKVDGGWMYTTYVWSEDGSTAIQENEGVPDLFGSGHTVPARQQCKECHSGRRDYILGWDPWLLGAGATGITREDLETSEFVTWDGRDEGVPSPLALPIPGDEIERAALGYLHSNCGVSCHNDTTAALALETGFFTRLERDALSSVVETPTFTTGLLRVPDPNAPLKDLELPPDGEPYIDLRPLDVEHSLLLVRMKLRNVEAAMPRIGTNVVDPEGVALVQAWIESMTEERGYPAE